MHIEDIVENTIGISSWTRIGSISFVQYDSVFLNSISNQLIQGKGLTEKQNNMVLKLLGKYSTEISNFLQVNINPFLKSPTYRYPIRTISNSKTVRLVENEDTREKIIRVNFPYNEAIINQFKQYQKSFSLSGKKSTDWSTSQSIRWNPTTTSWDFEFYESHLDWLHQNLLPEGFQFDQELLNIVEEINVIKGNIETHVPMVIFEDQKFKFINTHRNIPQPTSTDLIEVLFEAKKNGISIWDTSIDLALADESTNLCTKQCLEKLSGQEIDIDNKKFKFNDLHEIIANVGRCVFIIPGGNEYDTLVSAHNSLMEQGIDHKKMTVMFRLDSSAGAVCNEYIKEHQLNNPLTEETKFIFVSGRVPKPLISSKLPIDCIFNFGNNSAHYTLRNLLKYHHCVINYTMPRV